MYQFYVINAFLFYYIGGGGKGGMSLRSYLVVLPQVLEFRTFVMRKTCLFWLETKNTCVKCILSMGTPPPTLSAEVGTEHSRDKIHQALPLHFCILQVIKNWTVGRPGNEAMHLDKTTFSELFLFLSHNVSTSCPSHVLLTLHIVGV